MFLVFLLVSWGCAVSLLVLYLSSEVDQLSGGELQRFALGVVAAQEKDVYIVDEPSSYLDIRQRLRVRQKYCGVAAASPPLLTCCIAAPPRLPWSFANCWRIPMAKARNL